MSRDTDELYRVYRREWVIVHTVTAEDLGVYGDPHALGAEAQRIFEHRYAGRVTEAEARILVEDLGPFSAATLQLNLPVMKAEYSTEVAALNYAASRGWAEAKIVARDSPADHALRNYGTKKLPAA